MGLTKSDKEDLNKAIVEYLYSNGYKEAHDAFVEEASIDTSKDTSKRRKILEMKWKSVGRLKKQVLELEGQIKRYREDNDPDEIMGGQKEGLPKEPERFKGVGHSSKITRVTYHPIIDVLASSSEDASIKLWDCESGEIDKTMKGHSGKVNYIAFNKQGTMLASCSKDLTIKLWSLEKFTGVKTLQGHEHNISSLKFLPSGDQLVSASWDKTLRVWDTTTGFGLKTFEGHENWIMSVDVNSKGTNMVSSTNQREIIYWDLNLKSDNNIQSMFDEEHENSIDVVVFAPPKAARTITISRTKQEQEYDEQTGGTKPPGEETKEEESENTGEKKKPAVSSKLSKASEDMKKAREKLANLKANRRTKRDNEEEKKEEEKEEEVVIKNDFVASGSRDKRIKIWNANKGSIVMSGIGHDGWVNDLVFHPNGKYLISASDDKSIRIWDLEKNGIGIKKMLDLHTNFITTLAISRKSIATGGVDKSIKIFELR